MFDSLLETVQKLFLELNDLLNVTEQPFNVLDRQERLLFQRLQIPVDQTVYVLSANDHNDDLYPSYEKQNRKKKQQKKISVSNAHHKT